LRITDDRPSRWVGGPWAHSRELEGLRVGEPGVAAGVSQDDGVLRAHARQLVVQGYAVHVGRWHALPFFLVPAPAQDPGAGFRLSGRLTHHGHDVVPALRPR